MSVATILKLASAKTGLNPADDRQRQVLLRFLNEAAQELYTQCDMAGSLMEQTFKCNGDQTFALPSYVGPIRAVREYSSFIPWSLNQMRPRYNQSNWNDFWRNWRLKGKQALMSSISNTSVVTVVVPQVDTPNITVTVTGTTAKASLISETLTINALQVSGVQDFTDIIAVTKSGVTDYDVTLQDVDGKVLTVIPNNELAASYQIVDVSTCPWLNNSGNQLDHWVEVLYKKALPYLSNDGDEFPAQGYDFIVANKVLQIWFQEQGNAQEALAYDQLTTRSMARRHEEENRATEDVLALVENTHDNLNPRIRSRRPARYGGYSTTTRYGVM
tara:strand:+ start:1236 stop:2225 length:990 start_codon:yes stop_codon:yes gene_type:complete